MPNPPILTFVGNAPIKYSDSGFFPAIATSLQSLVEVHSDQDGLGPLSFRFGILGPWVRGLVYEPNGYLPALAGFGELAVEVHVSDATVAPLFYRIGRWMAFGIRWDDAVKYDDAGFQPSVGMGSGHIFEVHRSNDQGVAPLSFRSGTIGSVGPITWTDSAAFVTAGRPSVAVTPDGSMAIAVFEAGDGSGSLQYAFAQWYPSVGFEFPPYPVSVYEKAGTWPAVAMGAPVGQRLGPSVIALHEVQNPNQRPEVWYRTGTLENGIVDWGDANKYAEGFSPAVALSHDGTWGIEVHKASGPTGTLELVYQTFMLE